ncbi:amidase family protein [Hyaloscypha bicolor E]|uniref:Amidase family protein n=1 Tax=Hyaloscypha bicolor E TaxID=1095630 RepID=A0A2J6SKJ9_9HELO|nr:amidase family protein [Hyaloscypha bicolor E]PMD51277.1 amidase family protein [Hyaloscypha bicolor E]
MITNAPKTCLRMPRCHGIEIEECSIPQLQDYLSKAAFTSKELVQCYLRRIELVNPYVKAVIETNPDALDIADKLDKERKNGHIRTLLHGIPFIVKDNIATKDKMQTTAGCAALAGTIVPGDARIITLLREAGAVLLGKANLSEFASMRASYYAEGYSSRGGQNRNPYNLAHHPGGSSSGSASSLASNMCAFSIGTETDGSIMFPADRNAVIGLKPTVGLTSTMGVIPESPSMDTIGPFGRSVEDATIVLDIIHERRATIDTHIDRLVSISVQNSCPGLYTSWLSKKDALKGARFGIPWKRVWERASKNATKGLEYDSLMELIEKIEKAGALVIKVNFPSAEEIVSPGGWDWEFGDGKTGSRLSEFQVVRTEFYRNLRSYLSGLEENKIHLLEDVVAYNVQHTAKEGGVPRTHPAWPTGQDNFDKCLESKDWPEDMYLKALEYIRRKSRDEGIDAALRLEGDNLDGLLVPLQADGGVACSVAAKAGYPMITVPVGINNIGVPFGIGIIQTAFNEHLLVRYGSAIEDLVGRQMVPRFLNLEADNHPYVGTPPEKALLL